MIEEHPFGQYPRIAGQGPGTSRSLTEEETMAATRMILAIEQAETSARRMWDGRASGLYHLNCTPTIAFPVPSVGGGA